MKTKKDKYGIMLEIAFSVSEIVYEALLFLENNSSFLDFRQVKCARIQFGCLALGLQMLSKLEMI